MPSDSRHWWERLKNWRWQADRPYRLIAFALLPLVTVAILERLFFAQELGWLRDWVKRSAIYGPLFFPDGGSIDWKDRLQGVLLLLGLPVAFCLWYWRDRNVRDQIEEQRKQVENARKDINLKEFQEVQMRAAGALDATLPAEAREQLQIAALHQLRGFLRGEYGESFRRPAFELLLAGHAAAMERIGLAKAIDDWRAGDPDPASMKGEIAKVMSGAIARQTAVDDTRLSIMTDEWEVIFGSGFPLIGRNFDGINLLARSFPPDLDLTGASFRGANLSESRFEGANLCSANMEGADLSWTHLKGIFFRDTHLEGSDIQSACLERADLSYAHLEGADVSHANLKRAGLVEAHLEGANFWFAELEGADLTRACLKGTNLSDARLEGTELTQAELQGVNLEKAVFDDNTQLLFDWETHAVAERAAEQQKLHDLGARHVNDTPEVRTG